MIATADFETTTKADDCRVWAYGICEIGNPNNFLFGNSMDSFMMFCMNKRENHVLYFHNLKFDGDYIIWWLARNGYENVKSNRDLDTKTYSVIISDTNQFYGIEICFEKKGHKTNKVTIYDSLKILNFSVAQIAKDFGTGLQKLEMDNGYDGERAIGHELTKDEIMYLRNDVEIMSRALNYILNERCMDKMTIGADALNFYKENFTKKRFNNCFPILSNDIDDYIRKSYKGGFTYLADRYKNKIVGKGIVLDVNSLYPSVMYNDLLPYGNPLYFEGEYQDNKIYNLYVQKINCQFKVKKNHIPTIQIKGGRFCNTEYLRESGSELVTLTMTCVDLKLFFDHYNVFNLEYIDGYMFKSAHGMFTDYIDIWMKEKVEGKQEKNKGKTQTAKLMLNSLYGKFALSPYVTSKFVEYDKEKDWVRYVNGDEEERKPIYIPVGTFITAWARNKTIRSAQNVYDRFIYADTDSLHLEGLELPKELDIHPTNLGAWDNELVFDKAKYLRAKSYMEHGKTPKSDEEYEWKVTCAGMPSRCHVNVNIDNFEIDGVFEGKLQQKRVRGGVILENTTFKIKAK